MLVTLTEIKKNSILNQHLGWIMWVNIVISASAWENQHGKDRRLNLGSPKTDQ